MAVYMQGSGRQMKPMAKDDILMRMELFTRVVGRKDSRAAMVLRHGQMRRGSRDTSKTARKTVWAPYHWLMGAYTVASS